MLVAPVRHFMPYRLSLAKALSLKPGHIWEISPATRHSKTCQPGLDPGSSFSLDWIPVRTRFTRLSGMTCLKTFFIVIPAEA